MDTTFHTLDDIKKRAKDLGYKLVKEVTSKFVSRITVWSDITCKPRICGNLIIDVVKEDNQWWIRLSHTNVSYAKPIPLMYSSGTDSTDLAATLGQAFDELQRLKS